MTSYMNPQALEKAIKSIATRGAKLDADIQAAALSALSHLEKHNDAVFCGKLFLAMPAGSRRSALALWFVAFGAATLNTDPKTKAQFPFIYAKGMKTDLVAAAEKAWHEMKKEPDLEDVFDIKAALASVLKRAMKDGVTVNDPELLKGLNTLVGDAPTPAKAIVRPAGKAKAEKPAPAQASLV